MGFTLRGNVFFFFVFFPGEISVFFDKEIGNCFCFVSANSIIFGNFLGLNFL